MPGPEIHRKTTEVNGLTIQQVMLKTWGCANHSMADRMWEDRQSSDLRGRAQLHVSLQNLTCALRAPSPVARWPLTATPCRGD